jgi:hypothetical protein
LKVMPGRKGMVARIGARALLIAFLPSLLFLGHWTIRFDIPGTDLYVGMPESAHVHTEGDGHDHAQHCHANVASCSDVPFTGASAFALMSESVAYLGFGGVLLALGLCWWTPSRTATVAPEPTPPRRGAALFA